MDSQYRRVGVSLVDDWLQGFLTNAKETKISGYEYANEVLEDGRTTPTLVQDILLDKSMSLSSRFLA